MGGSVKKAFSNPVRAATTIGTFGTSELARRTPIGNTIFGAPEKIANSLLGTHYGENGEVVSDPGGFNIDPSADVNAINALGQSQYDETTKAIDANRPETEKYARSVFAKELPGLAEDYNGGGLLNSTGYARAVADKQSELADQLAFDASNKKFAALGQKQGFASDALQRKFSLEDLMRQANISRTLGHEFTPKTDNTKGNTGALLGGIGALGQGFGPAVMALLANKNKAGGGTNA